MPARLRRVVRYRRNHNMWGLPTKNPEAALNPNGICPVHAEPVHTGRKGTHHEVGRISISSLTPPLPSCYILRAFSESSVPGAVREVWVAVRVDGGFPVGRSSRSSGLASTSSRRLLGLLATTNDSSGVAVIEEGALSGLLLLRLSSPFHLADAECRGPQEDSSWVR